MALEVQFCPASGEVGVEKARSAVPACGFSLVETLVVMLIVSVLYWLALAPSQRRAQQQRELSECLRRLQQTSMVLRVYASDHDGAFPTVAGAKKPSVPLSLLVPQYTSDTSLFICPASGDAALPPVLPFAGRRVSYAYYMGYRLPSGPVPAEAEGWPLLSDAQIAATPKRRGKPVFSADGRSPGNNHSGAGGNILFADGHCEPTGPCATRDLPVLPGIALLNP